MAPRAESESVMQGDVALSAEETLGAPLDELWQARDPTKAEPPLSWGSDMPPCSCEAYVALRAAGFTGSAPSLSCESIATAVGCQQSKDSAAPDSLHAHLRAKY